jgi:hypothetical protein
VHFPIVFVVLLPIAAASAILFIRRGATARVAWLPIVGLALALGASSWVAVQTGDADEERAERVVSESAIHEHEEAAELFFPLTIGALVLAAGGLLAGSPGKVLRGATLIAAVGLAAVGYRVGHSGGALVYEHNAAAAFVSGKLSADLDDDGPTRSRHERDGT